MKLRHFKPFRFHALIPDLSFNVISLKAYDVLVNTCPSVQLNTHVILTYSIPGNMVGAKIQNIRHHPDLQESLVRLGEVG